MGKEWKVTNILLLLYTNGAATYILYVDTCMCFIYIYLPVCIHLFWAQTEFWVMIVLLRKDPLPDDDAMISFALRHRKQKTKDQPLVEIMWI